MLPLEVAALPDPHRRPRLRGFIEPADSYFRTRPRGSQLGALASDQSRPLPSRATLEERAAELALRYPDEIPRPPHWTGFAVHAQTIEFWRGRPDRLHDRALYIRSDIRTPGGWERSRILTHSTDIRAACSVWKFRPHCRPRHKKTDFFPALLPDWEGCAIIKPLFLLKRFCGPRCLFRGFYRQVPSQA